MSKNLFLFTLGMMTAFPLISKAESVPFFQVWKSVQEQSFVLQGQSYQVQAAGQAKESAEKHLLPRLYLDLKSYQTNDPGMNFFGIMQQRSLENPDFGLDAINHPSSHLFHRAALGVDLNLYEGGFSQSLQAMKDSSMQAAQLEMENHRIQNYAQVGLFFGSIAVLSKQEEKLLQLEKQLQGFLKNYQLGAKSNPVGYSGLLGLKSFANRLKSFLNQYKSEKDAYRFSLEELGWKKKDWTPEYPGTKSFIQSYFPWQDSASESSSSYAIQSMKQNVKSMEQMIPMEKSKLLPRAGVFAESYLFQGSRDTSQGATAGVYVQWNFFDPQTQSSVKEIELKSLASEKFLQAQTQRENLERQNLKYAREAIEENLQLLQQTDQLTLEQIQTVIGLFKNGSVNILQLVDLLNRRADLIDQEKSAEIQFLKISSEAVQKRSFQIPKNETLQTKEVL